MIHLSHERIQIATDLAKRSLRTPTLTHFSIIHTPCLKVAEYQAQKISVILRHRATDIVTLNSQCYSEATASQYLKAVLLGSHDGLDRESDLVLAPLVLDGMAHQARQDVLHLQIRRPVPFEDFGRVETFTEKVSRKPQELS